MNAVDIARGRMAARNGEGRRLRMASRLPLSAVANEVGVTPQAVARWEDGTALPRGHHAEAYARLLDELRALLPESVVAWMRGDR